MKIKQNNIGDTRPKVELAKKIYGKKKSHIAAGLLILKRLKDYFFFSFFSILAFKPARMSLLSPRVEAGEFVLEATAS